MRKVAQIMGMPVSIDVPRHEDPALFTDTFGLLRAIDKRFSPYKPESELCAYRAGAIVESALSGDMREVMQACQDFQERTNGYFSAYFGKTFDPTGYVKGWAIARAGELLESRGVGTYLINIAGDILARSKGTHLWRIALEHPAGKQETMGTIAAKNIAVATSGNYARGPHIVDPHTGRPATRLLSATIIGPDIVTADVLATAAFVMGPAGAAFVEGWPGYEALLVDNELNAHMSYGFSTQNAQ